MEKDNGQTRWHYRYDGEHRLTEVISQPRDRNRPQTQVSFRYDPLGRRFSKTRRQMVGGQPTGNPVTTRFVWEGFRLLQEVHGDVPLTYVYSDQDSYDPLARIDGVDAPEIFWFHCQPNGTPERMTDSEGQVRWEGVIKVVNPELHKGKPFAPLLEKNSKSGGRNNNGRITTRHIGGGHKQAYRIVDFKRNKDGIPAVVERLEYDPNRSANIALVLYKDGERRYILAPKGLKAGDQIQSGVDAAIKAGNTLPMRNIPVGSTVHNVEMKPGKGGQLARSAGTYVQIVARDGAYVTLRLRSGEMRKVEADCRATLGEVGNAEHMLRVLGKAGAARWRGVRPTVRGTAMNPVDHPHGGGEGRNFGKHPVTPWGVQTKGKKTRSNKRTDKFIVRRRSK